MSEESPKRFRIDPNVRLGDLLILATIAFGAVMAYASLHEGQERNARELVSMQVVQRERDTAQDTAMVEFKGTVRDSLLQIRSDVQDTRQDVKELSRFMRRGGEKGM